MRIGCIVNTAAELMQTRGTGALVQGLAARGHSIWVCGVADLVLERSGALAALVHDFIDGALRPEPRRHSLLDSDVLLLRTNPGRDANGPWAHATVLDFARLAADAGVRVLNDPNALSKASGKIYLTSLPEDIRAPTCIARDIDVLRRFIDDVAGPVVVKPLHGSRGDRVCIVDPADTEAPETAIGPIVANDYVVAQPFITDSHPGDKRMLFLDGALLRHGETIAAMRRLPADGDFRGNLHAGGHAAPYRLSADDHLRAARVGEVLKRDGIWLAAVDWVGDRVIEVNVSSPGGWPTAEALYGVEFTPQLLDAVEGRESNSTQ